MLAASWVCASALSCEDACDKGAGGGKASLEVAAQAHFPVAQPIVWGSAASSASPAAKVLDIDDGILAAADLSRPLDVVVAVGPEPLEAYALLDARSDAQTILAEGYQLQQIMHEQVRIKPRDGKPTRCMIVGGKISCTLLAPKVNHVAVWAERQVRLPADAGDTGVHATMSERFFTGRPGELLRERFAALGVRLGLVPELTRSLEAIDFAALGASVHDVRWTGSVAGERLELEGTANLGAAPPLARASLGAFGGLVARLPRDVIFAYAVRRPLAADELPAALAASLGDGRARAQRDKQLIEIYEVKDEPAAQKAIEEAKTGDGMRLAHGALWVGGDAAFVAAVAPSGRAIDDDLVVRVDLGAGPIELRVRVDGDTAVIHLSLDRAGTASLMQALSAGEID
jgi:hypothetical protein